MKAFVILSCAATVAVAQFGSQPLKEVGHLQAITEPHLPRDPNVLLATQNFLSQFAELKALADAAPDPPPTAHRPRNFAPIPVHTAAPHRFAPQPIATGAPVHGPVAQPSPRPSPRPHSGQFDVHGQIRTLLTRHQPATPTFAPSPAPAPVAAPRPAPTFAPARPSPVRFPNFSVLSSVGGHQRATMVPTGGRVHATGFTPEVLAAQKNLAAAHQNILRQQAALSPRIF